MSQGRPDRFATVQRVFVPYGLGAVLMGGVNVLLIQALQGQYPGVDLAYIRTCVSPLFAAVQEPITSKLLPAGLVLAWTGRAHQAAWLRERWLPVAAVGGLTVGLIELASKAAGAGVLSPALVAPVGLRLTLVDLHVVLLALGLAVLVHVGWNRYVWPVLAGPLPC
jgi:hypothetical protein